MRLIEFHLARFRDESGNVMQGIAPETLETLRGHFWPDNIREMQSVIRKAVLNPTGPVLVRECPTSEISGVVFQQKHEKRSDEEPGQRQAGGLPHADLAAFLDARRAAGSQNRYGERVEILERHMIARVLEESQGNRSRAAIDGDINPGRRRRKIRDLVLSIERHVSSQGGDDE